MKTWDYSPTDAVAQDELDEMLYSRHVELESLDDLATQRGTPIPALFNVFYKFIQNPSTVSVETFKRMVDTDDTIGSGVEFLVMCLAARLGRYQHPNEEITKFINDALGRVENGWTNAIKEMLSASWAGFSTCEKVWANTPNGFVIKKFVPLPPQTILFETERTGELTPDGILQYQRNDNPALMSQGPSYMYGFSWSMNPGGSTRPDPAAKLGDMPFPLRTANSYSYLSIRIPKQKVVHYSFDAQGKFGNPYGRSLLRKAYKFYVMKDSFLTMLSIALDRKGTPLTVVYADATAPIQKAGPNGELNPQGARGQRQEFVRADYEAKRAFENIHNDTVIILPGKKGQVFDHEFVNQQSNASDFLAAIEMCNKSIMRALLVPSLIFTNGDGTGSFALGHEHAKTFDKILDSMLSGFKQVLIDQVIQELIRYNFPEKVWQKDGFGDFSKRELSMDEIQKELEVVEKAVNIGAVDMNDLNDLNKIRDKMDFNPLTKVPERAMDIGGEEESIVDKDPNEKVNDNEDKSEDAE
jgi:hypothetical protein